MRNILAIADERIDSGLKRIFDKLDSNYESMLRSNNAKGLLRSGNTVKQTMNLISESGNNLKALIIEQSTWVVGESIYVPLTIAEDLINFSNVYFDALLSEAENYLRKASEMSGNSSVFIRVYPDVEKDIERSLSDTILDIEALVATNRSRGIKGIAKYLFSLVSKLWGG